MNMRAPETPSTESAAQPVFPPPIDEDRRLPPGWWILPFTVLGVIAWIAIVRWVLSLLT